MKRKKQFTVANITDEQFEWLKVEAERRGLNLSSIVKVWLQEQVERSKKYEM